jgi:hypothetical protein
MRSVLILDYMGLCLHVPLYLHGVAINTMNMAVLRFLLHCLQLGTIRNATASFEAGLRQEASP